MDLDWKKRLKARFAANNNIIEGSSESYPDAKFLKVFKEDLSSSYNPGVAYFLVDRKQMESTVWSIGVVDVLGYEKVGSLGEFLSWVHPKYKNFFWTYTEKGRDILMDKKIIPDFLNPEFILFMPIKSYSSNYIYCKVSIMAYRLDRQGQVFELLYRIQKIEPFKGQLFKFSFVDNKGIADEKIIEEYQRLVYNELELPFSSQESRILEMYGKMGESASQQIMKDLNITQNTLYTHHTNILAKTKEFFGFSFSTIFELSEYLQSMGLYRP